MKNGTILLYKADKSWISQAIAYFTKMPYSHTAGYVLGFTFEFTWWWRGIWFHNGVRVTEGCKPADEYWAPITPLTETQAKGILAYFLKALDERQPYNIFKLLILMLVYPTRWFWNKIGWVPFQADYLGEVCSEAWDEAYKEAGIDLFPRRGEQATAPGDFRKSRLLEQSGA